MDVDTVTLFLAMLAVLGLGFLLVCLVFSVVAVIHGSRTASRRPALPASLQPLRLGIGQVALPLAFLVALTCTVGSLYLSEVAKFPPCILCWYQRIVMYPQVIILGIAALRRGQMVFGAARPHWSRHCDLPLSDRTLSFYCFVLLH